MTRPSRSLHAFIYSIICRKKTFFRIQFLPVTTDRRFSVTPILFEGGAAEVGTFTQCAGDIFLGQLNVPYTRQGANLHSNSKWRIATDFSEPLKMVVDD